MFKKIIKILMYTLPICLLIGSFFFIKDYLDKDKKYKEYKNKVETVLKLNEKLTIEKAQLFTKTETQEKEKKDLIERLNKKQTEVVIKEKIVYKDGKLIIPDDYESLKANYSTLDDLYTIKSNMYDELKKQSDIDTSNITDLKLFIDKLQKENSEQAELLKNPVNPPVTFISQFVYGGLGITPSNTYVFSLGYGVELKEKLQGIVLIQYPFSISFLVGVRLK